MVTTSLPKANEFSIKLRSFHSKNGRTHVKAQAFAADEKKRKIAKAGRRGAKTTTIARIALEGFLAGRRVLYATPTSDQIQRFWAEVTTALAHPIAARILKKNESLHTVELAGTNQRIRAKTAWNADSLRGDYADLLILDEYQLMNEDAWGVVGAPMLADNNGSAIFIYTPPSWHTRSVTKASDPRHASKLFAEKSKDPRWGVHSWTSHDNPFISEEGLAEIAQDMTALAYRQEILAEDVDEIPGALWTRAVIESARMREAPATLTRIGIGVDPPGGATECGIVAAGIGPCSCAGKEEVHAFVLSDKSLKASPDTWGKTVADLYRAVGADRVYGEKNFGGDMVSAIIKTANAEVRYEDVQASRGKAVRAEPITALYEQGKVHHVGVFPALEDELCGWVPAVSPNSPNRLDAMVWVLTKLMLNKPLKWEII